MPLRRLFADRAALEGGPIGPRVEKALSFVEGLKNANAGFFRANPGTVDRFDKIKDQNRNYLAHEYFNQDWTPFYFADVAADLSAAKLSYVGSTALLEQIDAINLTADQRNLLAEIGDTAHRETIKDYIINQQFRRDVFVKGPVALAPRTAREAWLEQRFALSVPRADIELKVTGSQGEATLQPEVYTPVLDQLADGPKTVREMSSDPKVGGLGWARLQEALLVLTGAGHLQPCLPGKHQGARYKATKAFNQAVMTRAQDSGDLQSLASPVTGGGVAVGRFQQLFLKAFLEGKKEPEGWAEAAWEVLAGQGQKIVKDGKPLETPEENVAELREQARVFADKTFPVLKSLQVI
ncbi:MAG: methyltransferase regulatory domain-containing protein [Sulfitobacter sp.]|uniref:methyltransferase regulatory domain-containing protein n=1 Tax=Sulfitobacter sp. TaxID=1903071 RepID=UPI003297B0F1